MGRYEAAMAVAYWGTFADAYTRTRIGYLAIAYT